MRIHVLMPVGAVRDEFIPEDCRQTLATLGEVVWNESTEQVPSEQMPEILRQADVVITGWGAGKIAGEMLDGARTRLIAHTGGTVAPIVDESTYAHGIRVISGNPIYAESVAEGTLAYMLAGLRQIPYWHQVVGDGQWGAFAQNRHRGLLDRTIGLIGYGAIAKNVVRMLKPFHTTIKVHADYLTPEDCARDGIIKASLDEIAETCSVISLHMSLTPETRGLLGKDFFARIQPGALLINTARGAIFDEAALADALKTGNFSAVLDVFEKEPLPADSPLRGLPNVILIPHMAGPTSDRRPIVGRELAKDIARFARGEALQYEIELAAALRMTR